MKDISRFILTRNGVSRRLRKHPNECGVILFASFVRYRYWPNVPDWTIISVLQGSHWIADVSRLNPGPVWGPLRHGEWVVEINSGDGIGHDRKFERTLLFRKGDVYLVTVNPVERWPFNRPKLPVYRIHKVREGERELQEWQEVP